MAGARARLGDILEERGAEDEQLLSNVHLPCATDTHTNENDRFSFSFSLGFSFSFHSESPLLLVVIALSVRYCDANGKWNENESFKMIMIREKRPFESVAFNFEWSGRERRVCRRAS